MTQQPDMKGTHKLQVQQAVAADDGTTTSGALWCHIDT